MTPRFGAYLRERASDWVLNEAEIQWLQSTSLSRKQREWGARGLEGSLL